MPRSAGAWRWPGGPSLQAGGRALPSGGLRGSRVGSYLTIYELEGTDQERNNIKVERELSFQELHSRTILWGQVKLTILADKTTSVKDVSALGSIKQCPWVMEGLALASVASRRVEKYLTGIFSYIFICWQYYSLGFISKKYAWSFSQVHTYVHV